MGGLMVCQKYPRAQGSMMLPIYASYGRKADHLGQLKTHTWSYVSILPRSNFTQLPLSWSYRGQLLASSLLHPLVAFSMHSCQREPVTLKSKSPNVHTPQYHKALSLPICSSQGKALIPCVPLPGPDPPWRRLDSSTQSSSPFPGCRDSIE